jgi:hypothetical protein
MKVRISVGGAMPVTVEWTSEANSILLVTHETAWTWDEMFQAYQSGLIKVRAVSHPVHIIIDHTREVDPPGNFAEMLSRFAALPIPAHVGMIIQVGTKGATRIGTELFSLMYRRLQLVDQLEDAYALIRMVEERRARSG